MLPNTFSIPGKSYQYVDLRELFEMNGIPGRFRDWIRRKVTPLLGSAAIQYDRKDSHGNSRDFCVAKDNAIALLAMENVIAVRDLKDKIVPLPEIPYTHEVTILFPFHGFSTNKMYIPNPRRNPRQPLTKSPEYNAWIDVAKLHIGPAPSWFDKNKPTHVNYEFSMKSGSDCDNLIKAFQDGIFQHCWEGKDDSVKSHFVNSQNQRSYWCKATIYQ